MPGLGAAAFLPDRRRGGDRPLDPVHFEEWRQVSRRTIPDYSRMTYRRLEDRGGLQWPCNDDHPEGTPRLYAELDFPTQRWRAESCELIEDHDARPLELDYTVALFDHRRVREHW
jgi:predicted molibdopterin-dependent oxidoreductase YjgC